MNSRELQTGFSRSEHCCYTTFVSTKIDFDERGEKEKKNKQAPFDKTNKNVILICVRFRLFIRMSGSFIGKILSIVNLWRKLMRSNSDAYLSFCFSSKDLIKNFESMAVIVYRLQTNSFFFWIPFKGSTEQIMRMKVC